jgi:hypothetical protein
MTDKQAEEIAALRRELDELKAKVSPPKSDFVPMSDAEWRDQMHQLAEKRMSFATPPEVIRDWNVLDDNLLKGVRDDARAPTGRPGMIPNQQPSNARPVAGDGKGWAREIPIGPPPGIDLIDRGVNAALPHGPEWGKEKKEPAQ